ncbi:hypothetical protein BDZ89DRAFT_1067209 [Hymenopellis radicata]|nr:hypothetical protein BDZ89DRAFT_1067209 [Hymenopellis radicata]
MSLDPNATSVELCPKCHSFMPLTSYSLPFAATGDRAYLNPPQSDVSVIESMLSAPTTEISALATEILRVEVLLATLKKHHTYLDKHIQRSDAYVKPSPIRQFPTEILSLIFAAACTSFEPADYKTPLNISLVCSKWRAITLSTPTLWSHIYVGSSLRGRDIFEYYLRQCGKLPISIKIDIPLQSPPECNDTFPYEALQSHFGFMSYLSHTSEQWRVLELYVGCKDFNILTQYSRFPILEALTLGLKGNLDSVELPAALSYHAPVLSSLVLLDSSGTIDSERLVWEDCGLPEGLLNIRTNRGNLSYLLDLESSHCFRDEGSTLEVCGLHPSIASSISLRQITNLVLHPDSGAWGADLASIFKQVTIPYLKALTIISPYSTGLFERSAILELEWVRNVLGALPTFVIHSASS